MKWRQGIQQVYRVDYKDTKYEKRHTSHKKGPDRNKECNI